MTVGKYVRWADGFYVLFTNLAKDESTKFPTHAIVASCRTQKPISAGFFAIDGSDVICQGESSTLGIGVREDDAEFFRTELLQ